MIPTTLPKALTHRQTERLLAAASSTRDRALLEVLYATGLRVSELCALTWDDVDVTHQMARVRNGKGGKSRMVLFSGSTVEWLGRYKSTLNGQLVDRIFPVTRKTVWQIVKGCARRARLKGVSPHTLRHTFATHLLDGGANTRQIQELLGHSKLETTQVYTHVARGRLKAVHGNCHPRG